MGSTSRLGKEEVRGRASIAVLGNIDRALKEALWKVGHLFAPLPEALGEDMVFMDLIPAYVISAYMPGWPQTRASTLWA
jgi:predicted ATP-dependent Lon-type protease